MKFSDEQIQQLKDLFASRGEVGEIIKKELKPIKRDLRAMRKDLNWVMGKYDTRLVHLEKHAVHPPGRADN